jgi:hypothetical protein
MHTHSSSLHDLQGWCCCCCCCYCCRAVAGVAEAKLERPCEDTISLTCRSLLLLLLMLQGVCVVLELRDATLLVPLLLLILMLLLLLQVQEDFTWGLSLELARMRATEKVGNSNQSSTAAIASAATCQPRWCRCCQSLHARG